MDSGSAQEGHKATIYGSDSFSSSPMKRLHRSIRVWSMVVTQNTANTLIVVETTEPLWWWGRVSFLCHQTWRKDSAEDKPVEFYFMKANWTDKFTEIPQTVKRKKKTTAYGEPQKKSVMLARRGITDLKLNFPLCRHMSERELPEGRNVEPGGQCLICVVYASAGPCIWYTDLQPFWTCSALLLQRPVWEPACVSVWERSGPQVTCWRTCIWLGADQEGVSLTVSSQFPNSL